MYDGCAVGHITRDRIRIGNEVREQPGGAMNPARYMGPALLGGGLSQLWLYWVGPCTGAILAALLYHHVLEEKP